MSRQLFRISRRQFCMAKKTDDFMMKLELQKVYDSKPFDLWLQDDLRVLHWRLKNNIAIINGAKKAIEHIDRMGDKLSIFGKRSKKASFLRKPMDEHMKLKESHVLWFDRILATPTVDNSRAWDQMRQATKYDQIPTTKYQEVFDKVSYAVGYIIMLRGADPYRRLCVSLEDWSQKQYQITADRLTRTIDTKNLRPLQKILDRFRQDDKELKGRFSSDITGNSYTSGALYLLYPLAFFAQKM